jgi:hypothetical protein
VVFVAFSRGAIGLHSPELTAFFVIFVGTLLALVVSAFLIDRLRPGLLAALWMFLAGSALSVTVAVVLERL